MKSLFCLIALLYICLTVSYVSAQVGNEKLHLLVEYFLPYWRQHRGRLRPYAFAQPVPVWRVARSADESMQPEQEPRKVVDDEYIGCLSLGKQVHCERIINDRRSNEYVQCDVEENLRNPVLSNFVSYSIGNQRVDGNSQHFNLLPKKPLSVNLRWEDLRNTRELGLYWTPEQWQDKDTEGLRVKDQQCWSRLRDLLASVEPREVKVKKVNSQDELAPSGTEKVVGNLIVIDFSRLQ